MNRLLTTMLAVAVCVSVGCGGGSSSVGASTTGPTAPTQAPPSSEAPAGCSDLSDERRPAISIEDFKFVPKCFITTAGSALTVDNADSATHTFTVIDTEIDATILAGGAFHKGSEGLAAGEYPFFCRIHPFMKGSLTVV